MIADEVNLSQAEADAIEARLCILRFSEFVRRFWSTIPGAGNNLVWGWHLDVFCNELQVLAVRVLAGQPKEYDLIFNVPFGTSKSSVCSILFPAWVWTFMPHARFICASHTDSLVLDLADKSRQVIRSEKYRRLFPDVVLRTDRDAKEDYANTSGGERKSCTVGGKTPLGRHAHVIIIDDPLDPQRGRSEAELDTAAKFMTETIPSRVVDKATCPTILVMQRISHRDPTQVMLDVAKKDGATPVRQICLPGELSDDVKPTEFRSRYVGGLLDPVRMPKRVLRDFEARLGSYAYHGQVMQRPTPPGGGMFKISYFNHRTRAAPYQSKRIRYWDRASTLTGCYTAGILMAKSPEGSFYVENVVRGQWEPDERNEVMLATAYKDRSRYGPKYEPIIYVEMEGGSAGRDAWLGVVRKLAGFVVKEDRVLGSKDVRAEPLASQFAAGNFWLVDDGSWDINAYVEELCLFRPDPTHIKRVNAYADQVDSSSGAFNLLVQQIVPKGIHILPAGRPAKYKGLFVIACTRDELSSLRLSERALLVLINDPPLPEEEVPAADVVIEVGKGVVSSERHGLSGECISDACGTVDEAGRGIIGGGCTSSDTVTVNPAPAQPVPEHGLENLLDCLSIQFADLDSSDFQDHWLEEIPPWQRKPEELILTPELGKKLWSFLLRHRDPWVQVIVFCGGDDRRAETLASAVVETFRLPADRAMQVVSRMENGKLVGEPKLNKHLRDVVKASRRMVAM